LKRAYIISADCISGGKGKVNTIYVWWRWCICPI